MTNRKSETSSSKLNDSFRLFVSLSIIIFFIYLFRYKRRQFYDLESHFCLNTSTRTDKARKMGEVNLYWMRTCVEIPALLLFFSFTLSETIAYNFAIFRSCYVDLGFDRSDCEKLGSADKDNRTEEIEEEVHKYANIVLMVQEILTQVAPAILCLFLGPWSDKHGRKPVMTANMIGFCVGGIVIIVVVLAESISVWFMVGCSLAIAFFGGVSPFITAMICYISDITNEKNRGFRMGIWEAVMTAGMLIGTFSTSYVFNWGGYLISYVIVTICFFLALLYNIFVMVESLQFVEKKNIRMNIFSLKNLKDVIKVTFKGRKSQVTLILILTMIMAMILKFTSNASASVAYMSLLKKLNWDMQKYTVFKTLQELIRIIATVGSISLLHKVMNVREAPLIVVACVFSIASMLMLGFATEDWHVYLSAVLRSPSGILAPMVRSLLSKLVSADETGKVFSLTVALESIVLLGGIPLYTMVYDSTISTNPTAFNFVTAGLFALLVVFTMIVMAVQKLVLKENVFKTKNGESEDKKEEVKETVE